MSNPGEWINFEELCRRVPLKSGRTLRRYCAARLISFRQVRRGGPLEFNWKTVERELRILESPGVNAQRAKEMDDEPLTARDRLERQVADLNTKVDQLIALVSAARPERKAS